MSHMKFIRHKQLGFVIFEKHTDHSAMANYLGGKDQVMSAGFVMSNPAPDEFAPVVCFGESTTLRMEPGENDTHSLNSRLA